MKRSTIYGILFTILILFCFPGILLIEQHKSKIKS